MYDHPEIRCMEQTGYPSWVKNMEWKCPVCGHECWTIYTRNLNEIVGCDVCIRGEDAEDVLHKEEEL